MKIAFVEVAMGGSKSLDAMEPLAFAVLKGLTPDEITLKLYDERIEALPDALEVDWMVFSANSFTVKRAYKLMDTYKSQGVRTAIGGVHATLIPEEAKDYADTLFVGDAELTWPQFLEDLRNDAVKEIYETAGYPDISRTYFDESIFGNKKYTAITPVQFSRGCKFKCDFCSIHALYKESRRYRDVDCLVDELKRRKLSKVFFVDDNLFMDREMTKKLLKAITPLKIKWVCQISIDVGRDDELLKLMSDSGCVAVLIGFETTNIISLKQMNKEVNIKHSDYGMIIKNLKRHQLMIYGTFVIGYDG